MKDGVISGPGRANVVCSPVLAPLCEHLRETHVDPVRRDSTRDLE